MNVCLKTDFENQTSQERDYTGKFPLPGRQLSRPERGMEGTLALILIAVSGPLVAASGHYATDRSVYSESAWHISPAVDGGRSPTAEMSPMRGVSVRRGLFRFHIQ